MVTASFVSNHALLPDVRTKPSPRSQSGRSAHPRPHASVSCTPQTHISRSAPQWLPHGCSSHCPEGVVDMGYMHSYSVPETTPCSQVQCNLHNISHGPRSKVKRHGPSPSPTSKWPDRDHPPSKICGTAYTFEMPASFIFALTAWGNDPCTTVSFRLRICKCECRRTTLFPVKHEFGLCALRHRILRFGQLVLWTWLLRM